MSLNLCHLIMKVCCVCMHACLHIGSYPSYIDAFGLSTGAHLSFHLAGQYEEMYALFRSKMKLQGAVGIIIDPWIHIAISIVLCMEYYSRNKQEPTAKTAVSVAAVTKYYSSIDVHADLFWPSPLIEILYNTSRCSRHHI